MITTLALLSSLAATQPATLVTQDVRLHRRHHHRRKVVPKPKIQDQIPTRAEDPPITILNVMVNRELPIWKLWKDRIGEW